MNSKQSINASHYEAILFDLGGVLINLDYSLTEKAFVALGLAEAEFWNLQKSHSKLINDFETGQISSSYFINGILPLCRQGTSPNQVVAAWNAMILDFPKDRMNWLLNFSKNHRIFLLSNTNDLHMQRVNRRLVESTGNATIDIYFEKSFFSHEIEMRKPDVHTFQWVCDVMNVLPEKILFIDDSQQHVLSAKSLGINTILLDKGEEVADLFMS
jgi:FMN phosphatase YigB (HAD superfamily)